MSWFDRFVVIVCRQRDRFVPILAVLSLMGVLLAISFPFLEPGTAAYSIALLDLIILAVCFLSIAGTYRYCSKRAMEQESLPSSGDD